MQSLNELLKTGQASSCPHLGNLLYGALSTVAITIGLRALLSDSFLHLCRNLSQQLLRQEFDWKTWPCKIGFSVPHWSSHASNPGHRSSMADIKCRRTSSRSKSMSSKADTALLPIRKGRSLLRDFFAESILSLAAPAHLRIPHALTDGRANDS